jgi:hypothetical protein
MDSANMIDFNKTLYMSLMADHLLSLSILKANIDAHKTLGTKPLDCINYSGFGSNMEFHNFPEIIPAMSMPRNPETYLSLVGKGSQLAVQKLNEIEWVTLATIVSGPDFGTLIAISQNQKTTAVLDGKKLHKDFLMLCDELSKV